MMQKNRTYYLNLQRRDNARKERICVPIDVRVRIFAPFVLCIYGC